MYKGQLCMSLPIVLNADPQHVGCMLYCHADVDVLCALDWEQWQKLGQCIAKKKENGICGIYVFNYIIHIYLFTYLLHLSAISTEILIYFLFNS